MEQGQPVWMRKDKKWHSAAFAAIASMTDQMLLARVATEAPHWSARNAAVMKLTDQETLNQVALHDDDALVRASAIYRLTDQKAIGAVAREDGEWDNRDRAVLRMTDPSLLAQIAREDPNRTVRSDAMKRKRALQDRMIFDERVGGRMTRRDKAARRKFAKRIVVRYSPGVKDRLGDLEREIRELDTRFSDEEAAFDADGAWKRFDAMRPARQKEALSHSFSIENKNPGVGWAYPKITLDGKAHRCRISHIGPGVEALIDRVNGLDDGDDADLTWLDEPGEYTWHFSRRKALVCVELPSGEGVYLPYAELREKVNALKGRCGF